MGGGKGGGGGSSHIDVNNHGTTQVISDGTTTIAGLDNIHTENKTSLTLATPAPIQTKADSTQSVTIHVPEPIRNVNETTLDVKPLVADLCFTVTNRTPPTHIRQPYHHRFGVEMF